MIAVDKNVKFDKNYLWTKIRSMNLGLSGFFEENFVKNYLRLNAAYICSTAYIMQSVREIDRVCFTAMDLCGGGKEEKKDQRKNAGRQAVESSRVRLV